MPLLPFFDDKYNIEVGVDEAGRGCLCGDVFASAVILPQTFNCDELNDSKKLTDKKRREIRNKIEKGAIAYGIGRVSAEEIDRINILNASILAMHRALDSIPITADIIIVDGNRFKQYHNIEHKTIVKGDAKYMSIAAASILAKTYRDDYMMEMDKLYPGYGFAIHKGYPTKQHRQAIAKFGITDIHRKTFRLLK